MIVTSACSGFRMVGDDGGASDGTGGSGAGTGGSTTGAGGSSTTGTGGGTMGIGGKTGTGGAAGTTGIGGATGVGGSTGVGGAGGSMTATCTNGMSDNCGHALGAHGTCSAGTTTCSGGQWGACSIVPRSADTCVVGNDDTCDGRPNVGCLCDGFTPPPDHPNPTSYDTSVAGVATDSATGLAWQRTVPATTYAWADANAFCVANRLGGFSDWRLPSVVELVTIVDYGATDPSINSVAFPSTPSDYFWTSTPFLGFGSRQWAVRFIRGEALDSLTTTLSQVRCVRRVATARCYPPARYQVAGGLVTDAATGLTWQQAVSPQTMTWDASKTYCTSQAGGFRLATVRELQSIVDYTITYPGPAIDLVTFPATPGAGFWSSTPLFSATGSAWEVSFDGGALLQNGGTIVSLRARCVR